MFYVESAHARNLNSTFHYFFKYVVLAVASLRLPLTEWYVRSFGDTTNDDPSPRCSPAAGERLLLLVTHCRFLNAPSSILTMAKFSVLLSLLVVALVALSTNAFAPKPAFGTFHLLLNPLVETRKPVRECHNHE